MIELLLIGIGTGNPEHLTLQAVRALNAADLILIPRKGEEKAGLAQVRRTICAGVLTNPAVRIVEFDLPKREVSSAGYLSDVELWHDAIAAAWTTTIARELPHNGSVALLVWGDPALYDSSLRIAARLAPPPRVRVIPGITAIQALTASHAMPLNDIGAPFLVTTGRRLRDEGWPAGVDTLVVMLDGDCAFQHLDPAGVTIWWGANLGMPSEVTLAGPLADIGQAILAARRNARAKAGWVMDVYILRRKGR